jgi:hypothetical protein
LNDLSSTLPISVTRPTQKLSAAAQFESSNAAAVSSAAVSVVPLLQAASTKARIEIPANVRMRFIN